MDDKIKLALLAGIIASDGHLDKDRNAVRIITSDAEFLVVIETLLKDLDVSYRVWRSLSGFKRERFVVYFNNKKIRAEVEERYRIPKGRKSGTIKLPEGLEHQELAVFISGLFSGDGSIYSDNRTGKNYPQIMFWTKSEQLAKDLLKFFQEQNINANISFSELKKQHRLTMRRRLSVLKFREVVGFVNPRKKRMLDVLLLPESQRRETVAIQSPGSASSLRRRYF